MPRIHDVTISPISNPLFKPEFYIRCTCNWREKARTEEGAKSQARMHGENSHNGRFVVWIERGTP